METRIRPAPKGKEKESQQHKADSDDVQQEIMVVVVPDRKEPLHEFVQESDQACGDSRVGEPSQSCVAASCSLVTQGRQDAVLQEVNPFDRERGELDHGPEEERQNGEKSKNRGPVKPAAVSADEKERCGHDSQKRDEDGEAQDPLQVAHLQPVHEAPGEVQAQQEDRCETDHPFPGSHKAVDGRKHRATSLQGLAASFSPGYVFADPAGRIADQGRAKGHGARHNGACSHDGSLSNPGALEDLASGADPPLARKPALTRMTTPLSYSPRTGQSGPCGLLILACPTPVLERILIHPLTVIQMNATNSFPDKGGIATYTHELAHHLGLHGLAVKLLTYPSASRSLLLRASYPVLAFSSFDLKELIQSGGSRGQLLRRLPPKVLGMARDTLKVLRTVPAGSKSVLWAVQWWPEALAAWLVSRLKRIPYVITAHGFEAVVPAETKRHFVYEKVMNSAAAVFAVSRHTAGLLLQCGVGGGRIRVVHNGVRPERFEQTTVLQDRIHRIRQRWSLDDRFVLLTVARLVERKGHSAVLKALAALRSRMPDCCYVIAGDGPLWKALHRQVADFGMEDVTIFTGEVSEEDKAALLHVCDVFVMPNRDIPREKGGVDTEGFGIVFLEAAACGKPVVGGRAGGVPEAVLEGETGLLVGPSAGGELEDALYRLWSDRDFSERLGRQGRERVRTGFTWERVASQYRRAFESFGS